MDSLKEKNILQDKNTEFRFSDLNLTLKPDEELRYKVLLNNYFTRIDNGSYSISLPGALAIIVESAKRVQREIYYEELINQIRENLSMIIPASVLFSYDENEIATQIELAINKIFMVADNQEYNGAMNTYVSKNIMAISADVDLMTENPLER